MHRQSAARGLFISAGVLLAFLLVAGSLSELELSPGLRITVQREPTGPVQPNAQEREEPTGVEPVFNWLVSLLSGLAVLVFLVSLIRRESRRASIQYIVIGLAVAGIFALLTPNPTTIRDTADQSAPLVGDDQSSGSLRNPEFEPEETYEPESRNRRWPWSVFLLIPVGIGLVLTARRRTSDSSDESHATQQLRSLAAEAAEQLRGEVDVANVVIQCYQRMLQIMEEKRSVHRNREVTAREFRDRLVQAGVSSDDVDGLTRLFERFRYGAGEPTLVDQSEAQQFLRNISVSLGGTDA